MAIVLVAAVLVGVAAIGLSHLGGSRPAADTGATATTSWKPDPTTTTSSPTRTTHRTVTPPPTTSRRTSTSTTPEPPDTSTEPAGPKAVVKLGDNPLFDLAGLPATNCKLTRWSTDPAGSERFLRSAVTCLDAAWAPVLKAANLPFATPNLTFPSGTTWNSPCGAVNHQRAAAFYCPQDSTLYMPFEGLDAKRYGAHPGVYLAVLAHEYGHHVQNLTGIESAYVQGTYSARSDDDRLELSRRLELEAQCFSGMFLAATSGRGDVDGNITQEAQTTQDRGDHNGPPRDHGTDEHAEAWWNQGFQRNSLAQCDTWVSSSADVA